MEGVLQSVSKSARAAGVVVNGFPMYTDDQLRLWKLRLGLLRENEDALPGFTVRNDGAATEFWKHEVANAESDDLLIAMENEISKRQKPDEIEYSQR